MLNCEITEELRDIINCFETNITSIDIFNIWIGRTGRKFEKIEDIEEIMEFIRLYMKNKKFMLIWKEGDDE